LVTVTYFLQIPKLPVQATQNEKWSHRSGQFFVFSKTTKRKRHREAAMRRNRKRATATTTTGKTRSRVIEVDFFVFSKPTKRNRHREAATRDYDRNNEYKSSRLFPRTPQPIFPLHLFLFLHRYQSYEQVFSFNSSRIALILSELQPRSNSGQERKRNLCETTSTTIRRPDLVK
jgi:hypothetical protein